MKNRMRVCDYRESAAHFAPLPGRYRIMTPSGEVVWGDLHFVKGWRGRRDRQWMIAGARFFDEQLTGWAIGPRMSGPGCVSEPIAVEPDAVIAYMLAIVNVLPGQVLGLSHRVSVSPEDGDRTDVVAYRRACKAWTAEEAVDWQSRIHDEVERVAPSLAGKLALDEQPEAQ